MNKPLVSVIVPIYNIESYVSECVDSILGQTYENLQIILVDDGSVDKSGNIIDNYGNKDLRIEMIHKENGGLVSARKAGLKAATGDYVMYVDGDDFIDASFIEELVTIALENESDVVTSAADLGDRKLFDTLPVGTYKNEKELTFLFENMLSTDGFYCCGILPYLWGKLWKKSILYDVQMSVDEKITVGEDVACTYRALANAHTVNITSICRYHYRQREDSMVGAKKVFADETIEHLSTRFKYMKKQFQSLAIDNIEKQLNEYAYYTLFCKFPDFLFSEDGKTLYSLEIKNTDRIVLYGNGKYKEKLVNILENNNFGIVIKVIDKYPKPEAGVESIISLLGEEYDKIVLAVTIREHIEQMKTMLNRFKIKDEVICAMHISDELCKKSEEILMNIE